MTKCATLSPRALVLIGALGFVLGCRLLLHAWIPGSSSNFDLLSSSAGRLLAGENPYSLPAGQFPYPLPALFLAVPFTLIPAGLARLIFDLLVGWAFAYALWQYRGPYALLALLSGAYFFALAESQTTPLMVAASLVPVLGFLLVVKPNTSLPLWTARPSWIAVLGAGVFFGLSLLILPTWPRDWWMALPPDNSQWLPPLLRPFGFLLLLAALRWRSPEGRLLFAIAFIPQTALPYELVSLALIPTSLLEMGIYAAGTWLAVLGMKGAGEWAASGWTVTLCAVYLPMLALVLLRKSGGAGLKLTRERRRAHRLPDDELQVDVIPNGAGVIVKVTHLPTGISTREAAATRELAERKAQDKLAARLAQSSRLAERPERSEKSLR